MLHWILEEISEKINIKQNVVFVFGTLKKTTETIIVRKDNIREVSNKKNNKKLPDSASLWGMLSDCGRGMQTYRIIAQISKNMQYWP